MAEAGLSFAGLLRQLRVDAQLTQEELAEAARVSPRSVSDLERGINRTAHKDTALLLAGALCLDGPVAELFVAAARGRRPAADVLAARQREAPAAGHNLPVQLTSLLGREQGLAALEGLIGNARSRRPRDHAAGVCPRDPDRRSRRGRHLRPGSQ